MVYMLKHRHFMQNMEETGSNLSIDMIRSAVCCDGQVYD